MNIPPCETFNIKSMKILWQKGHAPYLRLSHAALTYNVKTSTLTVYSSASSPDIWDPAEEECREEEQGGGDDEEVDKRSSSVMIVYFLKMIFSH